MSGSRWLAFGVLYTLVLTACGEPSAAITAGQPRVGSTATQVGSETFPETVWFKDEGTELAGPFDRPGGTPIRLHIGRDAPKSRDLVIMNPIGVPAPGTGGVPIQSDVSAGYAFDGTVDARDGEQWLRFARLGVPPK